MDGPVVLDRVAISALCERYGVKRLVVFGSAVPERFDGSTSDVDFLVQFRADVVNRCDAYFGLKESLEAQLGCPVNLVATVAHQNPYFAASVAASGRSYVRPEAPALLGDARRATGLIAQFVGDRTWFGLRERPDAPLSS